MRLTDELLDGIALRTAETVNLEPPAWLWSKQREIMRLVDQHPKVAVASSHGVGKTFVAANIVCRWLDLYWQDGLVVSTAPTSHQVRNLLWQEIRNAHPAYGGRGRLNQTSWYDGGDLKAVGVTANDTKPETLQGYHAPKLLYVIDEASAIPRAIWDAVMTTLTNDGSHVLAIGNPDDPTSAFAQCWNDPSWIKVNISAFDTPLFTGEPITERAAQSLVSVRWVLDRKAEWGINSNLWTAKVLGQFPDSKIEGIIPSAWWRRDHLKPVRVRQIGVDLAGEGDDYSVIWSNIDGDLQQVYAANTGGRAEEAFDEVAEAAAAHIRAHAIETARYDAIGVGYGFGSVLKKHLGNTVCGLKPFVASEAATDPKRFVNKRAEAYWQLRQQLHEQALNPSAVDQDVIDQFTSTNYLTKNGKIQIEAKADIRKRIGQSPDHADALVMATYRPGNNNTWQPISHQKIGRRR